MEEKEMEPWEKELREWASKQPGFPPEWFLVSAAKRLINDGLLRPVEDEPAECPSEAPEPRRPSISSDDVVAYVNWLCDQNISRHSEIKTLMGRLGRAFDEIATLRANHAARIDDAHGHLSNAEAKIDLLQARLDAAEAEVKGLKAAVDALETDNQRIHIRINGVIDRLDRLCKAGLGVV